jgi:light-regulated signal transduction histidine kinase (bacteriophytochrome)
MQLLQGPVVLPELPVIVPKSSPESDRHKPGTLYKAIRRRMAELEAQNGDLDPATRTLVDRLRGPVRDMNGHARFLREAYPTLSGEKLLDCLERLCRQAQELETIVDELLQQVSIRPKGAEIPSQE